LNLRVAVDELLSRTARFRSLSPSAPQRNAYPSNGLRELHIELEPHQ